MRKRFAGEQQSMPQSTVKDQIVSGGIAGLGQQGQAPQGRMMPQMPAAQPMPPQQPMPVPPQPMPQQMPQQAMSNGGVVRMSNGQDTSYFTPQGATLEELAGSMYDYQRPRSGPRGRRKGETRSEMMGRILGPDAYQPPSFLAGPGARSKFVESAVESGMLEQYLPREEDQFLETKVVEKPTFESEFNLGNAAMTDAERLDRELFPLATSVDEEITALGLSDKSTEDKVNEDLYSQTQEDLRTLSGDISLDVSPIRTAAGKFANLTQRFKDRTPADYQSLIKERTQDFMQFAPDYESLITDQELKAKKIREDARKDAGAQALIQLGAGILEGNVGEGLRGAGKASSDIMTQARAEAAAEEKLANSMRLSQEEARMNLGVMGEEAAQRQYDRNTDLIIKEYADDRATQLAAMGMEADNIKSELAAETSIVQLLYGAESDKRTFALERLVKVASVERFKDLKEEEKQATLRAIIQQIQDPFEEWFKSYQRKNPNVSMETLKVDVNNFLNAFITAYGQKPIALEGDDDVSVNVPNQKNTKPSSNRIRYDSDGNLITG